MIILSCDTSTKSISVAVCNELEVITHTTLNTGTTHSQVLMPLIQEVLTKSGMTLEDVDLFACTTGPGSFTGIRIGVSAVKAMAYALEKPVAGISTLQTLAYPILSTDTIVVPIIDARNRRVFSGAYIMTSSGTELDLDEKSRDMDELINEIDQHCKSDKGSPKNLLFCGDAAELYNTDPALIAILERLKDDHYIGEYHFKRSDPDARYTAMIARERFLADSDPAKTVFNPFGLKGHYLVPSGAERNRSRKKRKEK